MFTLSHLLSAAAAALVLIVVIDMLRRGRLRERHALWWLLAGAVGLVVTLFPGLLSGLSSLLGIADPLNLAFFGGIIVLFLVTLQQSIELTRIEERARTLAEQTALLDDRIRQLESLNKSQEENPQS